MALKEQKPNLTMRKGREESRESKTSNRKVRKITKERQENLRGLLRSNGKIFRRRLTLNDADQNFATIRYGVTTLVNPARNAPQTSVTE